MTFQLEQISEEDLKEIAKKLNIEEGELEGKSPEQLKELVEGEIKKLQEIKNKVGEIPGLVSKEENKINDDKLNELKELEPSKIKKLIEELRELGIENIEDTAKKIKNLRNKNNF